MKNEIDRWSKHMRDISLKELSQMDINCPAHEDWWRGMTDDEMDVGLIEVCNCPECHKAHDAAMAKWDAAQKAN